ncbi:MAG: DUF5818 domain-containing protein [Candidatus Acidiferrales bacterium]
MKHLLAVASVMGFAFCAAVPSASPRIRLATPVAVPSATSPQPGNTADQPQKFVGTIVSMNGERFILRDDANDVWYHLDNQQEAGKYLGKKVEVTGTLEGRSDEILVQSIQVEKS